MENKIGGLIEYYKLSEWWLNEFNEEERKLIINKYKPMMGTSANLREGNVSFINIPVTQFLNELATWFEKKEETHIKRKILNKIDDEAKSNPLIEPGFFGGRHYTTFVEEAKQLKRDGKIKELEKLLWNLVSATEEEDKVNKWGVAPWYYEELAILYRKLKDYASEVSILLRYKYHQLDRKSCTSTPILLKRLEKAEEILKKSLE